MTKELRSELEKAAEICRKVCDRAGITIEEIASISNQFRVSHPRQVAMALVHEKTNLPASTIAGLFGKHRTMIYHAQKKIRKARKELAIVELYDALKDEV